MPYDQTLYHPKDQFPNGNPSFCASVWKSSVANPSVWMSSRIRLRTGVNGSLLNLGAGMSLKLTSVVRVLATRSSFNRLVGHVGSRACGSSLAVSFASKPESLATPWSAFERFLCPPSSVFGRRITVRSGLQSTTRAS